MDAKRLWSAFQQQLHHQLLFSGPPESEHAVHLCLAVSLVSAGLASAGDIAFERPLRNRRRVDVWLADEDIAIEVKFWRPVPSGQSRPWTQLLGGLLADFNKLAREEFTERWVLLLTDPAGRRYLERSPSALIPAYRHPRYRDLRWPDVQRLHRTAVEFALADGAWVDLTAHLVNEVSWDDWCALSWRITPLAAEPNPETDSPGALA